MTLSNPLSRYREDEDGTLTVEAVILLPVLLVMFAAMLVLFDYFRAHSVAGKTAYTVGDMISRETNYITPTYMDGALDLVEFMNHGATGDTGLRVTIVSYNADDDALNVHWSRTAGVGLSPLNTSAINQMRDQIPMMPEGLHMILVETTAEYDPFFNIGLNDATIETFVTTVPRFAPQVLWQG